MKKLLAILMASALSISVLSSCGTGNDSGSQTGENGSPGKVTLQLWDTFVDGSLNSAMSQIISAYEESHSDVKINRVQKELTSLGETIKAAFMAGDAPDLLYYEGGIGTVGSYVKAGYLMDLSEAYKTYGWKDKLMSACWEVPSVGDYIYGVGHEMETMSLYFNQDIFDKVGLENPTTIEELTDTLQKLKDAGYTPLANTMGAEWSSNMNFIGTILYAYMSQDEIKDCMENDGSWDKESVRKAIDTIKLWIDNGYFPDHPEVHGDQEQLYFSQECAAWITGNWEVGNITKDTDFKTTIIPFPGSESCEDGGSQVNFAGGAFLVNAATAYPDESLGFIDYVVATPESSKVWYEVGGTVPPYTDEYEVEANELGEHVVELLGDETLQNTAGINMWLGTNAFEFFSFAGQNLIVGSLDTDSFIAEADAALQKDVESKMTKGSFTFE
ncbi:ABC transporter substrate-binding protein [Massiliimalia timonensis]|uniref:ABC transporter substrate-binding protein n=1 Tax=Massiliimalia timonensis TaxID=1987501 RepID=UPI00189F352B|nr:extracellular solute-binding protein [Massiliimalia timonensis]